jgi:MoaA/NifB/PqqE/SkfB family radical SAM enzyme
MTGKRPHDLSLSQAIRAQLRRLPALAYRAARYRALRRGRTAKPNRFVLCVTRRCPMRCLMCSIIATRPTREPTVDEVRRILGNRLLDRVATLVITGGEPTVRRDLVELVGAAIEANRGIEEVWVATNAGDPDVVERQVRGLVALPGYQRLRKLGIHISLDGHGEVHEGIRGLRRGAFARIDEAIARLKRIGAQTPLALQINCTVQRQNVDHLPQLAAYAERLGISIVYTPVDKLSKTDEEYTSSMQIAPEQLATLRAFLDQAPRTVHALPKLAFWEDFFRMQQGAPRRFPCVLPYLSVIMLPEGDLYICGTNAEVYGNVYQQPIDEIWTSQRARDLRRAIWGKDCVRCTSSCNVSASAMEEVVHFAGYLAGQGAGALAGRLRPSRVPR